MPQAPQQEGEFPERTRDLRRSGDPARARMLGTNKNSGWTNEISGIYNQAYLRYGKSNVLNPQFQKMSPEMV